MNIKSGIYKITSPTGKVYIGQSVHLLRRLYEYKSLGASIHGQPAIFNSLKKYGPENHKFEIIEECIENILDDREVYWKIFYNSVKEGLNCQLYDGKGGYKSEETKQKMRKPKKGSTNSLKGRKQSQETCDKKSKAMKGKHFHTDISKQNISEKLKGKSKPQSFFDKMIGQKRELKYNPILQYDLDGNFIKEWFCTRIAANELGFNENGIYNALKGTCQICEGFKWKRKI